MNTMQTTKIVDKSVAISQLKLNRDVQEHIKGYLFYDKEQVFLRREKKKYVNEIKNAISQKLLDEISAHWCFGSGTTQFQAIFCPCGGYLWSNTESRCNSLRCNFSTM
jgi:hypothetical protein